MAFQPAEQAQPRVANRMGRQTCVHPAHPCRSQLSERADEFQQPLIPGLLRNGSTPILLIVYLHKIVCPANFSLLDRPERRRQGGRSRILQECPASPFICKLRCNLLYTANSWRARPILATEGAMNSPLPDLCQLVRLPATKRGSVDRPNGVTTP